jgi:protein-S-isoprenylcysteine O-methyltransferase Ste14
MLSRFLPLAGVILFFGVGFIWRAWLQYRRYGQSGIILFRSARATQQLRDALFVALLLIMTTQAIAAAIEPAVVNRDSIFAAPLGELALAGGAGLLVGGTVLMVAAQLRLGKSWRIGIDEAACPGLVTGGLYRFSRNPIFLGMFIVLAGLTVLLPTWLSVVALLGSIICVRSQVLEEEAYLTATYGPAYQSYVRRVGRFLPRFVRGETLDGHGSAI